MNDQFLLFKNLDDFTLWKKEWNEMPEFIQENLSPWRTIDIIFSNYFTKSGEYIKSRILKIHFINNNEIREFKKLVNIEGINHETKIVQVKYTVEEFANLMNQKITDLTKSIWFSDVNIDKPSNWKYVNEHLKTNPQYPIYIISKGRWDSRLTSKAFEEMNIPYHIVIEPQEYKLYASVIDPKKILVLPFQNLGQGSIPARNWVWKHSISIDAKRHWIIDDNINAFCRLNKNTKIKVTSGSVFKVIEDFVDRYENVALSGMNYRFFASQRSKQPAFYLNTRIYSCILIKNDIPFQWRGKYNEDTDLSIRVLRAGYCTILFQAFLCDKIGTMKMKGGNTDELYQDDGRLKMAQSLADQHPDIVTITWKWGRWQHQVDYSAFKNNKLIRKSNYNFSDQVNNYGMILKHLNK